MVWAVNKECAKFVNSGVYLSESICYVVNIKSLTTNAAHMQVPV